MDINENNILCPDLNLSWETEFTILGFVIDNKLQKLHANFEKCNEKVKSLIIKWRAYGLSINGRITISKTLLLPQYTYIGSVLDKVSVTRYKNIQKILDHFVLHNSYLEPNKSSRNWIKPDILYADRSKGGYGQIEVDEFFKSIKTSWVKRYATGKLDNWGANKFNNLINQELPCISEFVKCYREFSICFPTEVNTKENRWLSHPFFYNPKIQFGNGRARRPFTSGMFGMEEKSATLSLGQLFVNLKPISFQALDSLGHPITILGHNSLTQHLKNLVGHGKLFDGHPKKVVIKYDRSRPIPCHLIDNIKDYMKCFKKGSSTIRKVFSSANKKPINYDIQKFTEKN